MSRVAGDSAQVRELGRKLLDATKEIIGLNSRSQKLLDSLGQTWKDGAFTGARETVGQVAETVLAGLPDVKETCRRLGEYADFLASIEEEGRGTSEGAFGSETAPAGLYAGLSSGRNSGGALSPAGTTDAQIADHEFTRQEKLDWVCSVVPGCGPQEAERIVASMEAYSGADFSRIHWDADGAEPETGDILKVFDAGRAPVYRGDIYRGLRFGNYDQAMKVLMAGRGTWTEPGITSFSTDINISEQEFAGHSGDQWGLLFTCRDNKTAIPFQHMSVNSREAEVLSPGGHRNSGWRIDFDSLVIDHDKHMIYADIYEN